MPQGARWGRLAALLFLHAIGAAIWLLAFVYIAYVLSVPEVGTPGDIDDLGFLVTTGVAGALWLAAAVLAVKQWRQQRMIWWIPFAWWTPTLILASLIQARFEG
jgi:hypothetical protein